MSSLLLILLLSSRAEPTSVSNVFPPGSYTNWLSLLTPKSRLHGRLLRSLLWSPLPVRSLLVSAVWPSVLLSEVLRLLRETCACSNFAIGLASPLLVLAVSACSFVRRLFGLASVYAGGLGDAAAAIDEGGGGESS